MKKITKEELIEQYTKQFPYEPNNQRIGRYAKSLGLQLTKQMINGKYVRFYIKCE